MLLGPEMKWFLLAPSFFISTHQIKAKSLHFSYIWVVPLWYCTEPKLEKSLSKYLWTLLCLILSTEIIRAFFPTAMIKNPTLALQNKQIRWLSKRKQIFRSDVLLVTVKDADKDEINWNDPTRGAEFSRQMMDRTDKKLLTKQHRKIQGSVHFEDTFGGILCLLFQRKESAEQRTPQDCRPRHKANQVFDVSVKQTFFQTFFVGQLLEARWEAALMWKSSFWTTLLLIFYYKSEEEKVLCPRTQLFQFSNLPEHHLSSLRSHMWTRNTPGSWRELIK